MANRYADLGLIPVNNPILGMIDEAAQRHGVDRNLAHVVAQMESNYNPKADSGKAQGVMQLAPPTARELGVRDPFDPAQNIDAGIRHLKRLSDKFNGDNKLVLAAYNAGEGAVQKYGGVPKYRETQNYVTLGTRKLGSANREAEPAPGTLRPDAKAGPYITTLNPVEESQFQSWVKDNRIPFDPSPTSDYDMRGFWRDMLAGKATRSTSNLHFPDTYKTPYHQSFSNESIYATADAPHWEGDRLIDKTGKVVFDEAAKKPAEDLTQKYSDLGLIPADQMQAAPQPQAAAIDIRKPATLPGGEPDESQFPQRPTTPAPTAAPAQPKTFEGFMGNLGSSTVKFVEGALSPILHPVQTVQGISELTQAMSEKSGFKPIMGRSHLKTLDDIGEFYKQRYGSWQGFKDAWYNDPAGMAADLATVVSTAGLGAKAAQDFIKVAGLSEQAAAAANAIGKAGTMAKGSAVGAFKALPEVPVEAFKGAVVGGIGFQNPIAGAKLGALNALRKGAAEGAREALAARAQRVADALKAEQEARAAQRIVIGDRPAPPAQPAPPPAQAAEAAAAAGPSMTPGQAYAQAKGIPWQNMSAKDRAFLEQVAAAEKNVANQPTEVVTRPTAAEMQVRAEDLTGQPTTTARTPAQVEQELNQRWDVHHDLVERHQANPTPETQAAVEQSRQRQYELYREYQGRGPETQTPAPPPAQDLTQQLQTSIDQAQAAKREPVDFAARARSEKLDKLERVMVENGLTGDDASIMDPGDWKKLAKAAGVNEPSGITQRELILRLRNREAQGPPPAAATAAGAAKQSVNAMLDAIPRVKYKLAKTFGRVEWETVEDLAGVGRQSDATRQAVVDAIKRREGK